MLQVDLSTVQAQSLDSNELQFHTSRIVNSAEIHVSSPDDINTIPDTCDELMHSPSISIPDVEVRILGVNIFHMISRNLLEYLGFSRCLVQYVLTLKIQAVCTASQSLTVVIAFQS